MSFEGLVQIKKAIGMLSPKEVRELGQRDVHIGIHASDHASLNRMEDFLLSGLRPLRRRASADLILRNPRSTHQAYVNIYDAAMPRRRNRSFIFPNNRACRR